MEITADRIKRDCLWMWDWGLGRLNVHQKHLHATWFATCMFYFTNKHETFKLGKTNKKLSTLSTLYTNRHKIITWKYFYISYLFLMILKFQQNGILLLKNDIYGYKFIYKVWGKKDSYPLQNENFQFFYFDCSCLQKYSCEYTNVQ